MELRQMNNQACHEWMREEHIGPQYLSELRKYFEDFFNPPAASEDSCVPNADGFVDLGARTADQEQGAGAGSDSRV